MQAIDFVVNGFVKPSEAGIRNVGLSPDLRALVLGVDPKTLCLDLEGKKRTCPASWFEPLCPGEHVTTPKPVRDRYDECRFSEGDRVSFETCAKGFSGKTQVGTVILVVVPRVEPIAALLVRFPEIEKTHSFRIDRQRLEPAVRSHRYWIEAIPNESTKGKPCLFLKLNRWVTSKYIERSLVGG